MKKEKNTYEKPQCEVIRILTQDLIAASPSYGGLNPDFTGGYGTEDNWG